MLLPLFLLREGRKEKGAEGDIPESRDTKYAEEFNFRGLSVLSVSIGRERIGIAVAITINAVKIIEGWDGMGWGGT